MSEEGIDQPVPDPGGEPFRGDDGAAGDPPDSGHAGDAGGAIDEHGATPTLALRAASVLDGANTQVLSQGLE